MTTMNERRAEIGLDAVRAACGETTDLETAASDTIADILHALYGVHASVGGEDARFLLDHAYRSWQGDDEDEGMEA